MTVSILQPVPLTASGIPGAANLLTPDPREVAKAAAPGPVSIRLDLAHRQLVDTVFLGFTNVDAGTTVSLDGDGAFLAAGTIAHSYRRRVRRHAFLQLAQAVEVSFLVLHIATDQRLMAGVVAAGRAMRFARGHEFGSGRPISDPSAVQRLIGGGFGISRGAAAGGWQFTIVPSDDERDRLYAALLDQGTSSPFLVAEAATGGAAFNEALHWGLMTRIEPWNRDTADESKWQLSVTDWA